MTIELTIVEQAACFLASIAAAHNVYYIEAQQQELDDLHCTPEQLADARELLAKWSER